MSAYIRRVFFVFVIPAVMYWAESPFFPSAAALFFILAAAGEVSEGLALVLVSVALNHHITSHRVIPFVSSNGK